MGLLAAPHDPTTSTGGAERRRTIRATTASYSNGEDSCQRRNGTQAHPATTAWEGGGRCRPAPGQAAHRRFKSKPLMASCEGLGRVP
jgi:hypothetical protein